MIQKQGITVGEGTPGKRMKSAWRSQGAGMSLRQWARGVLRGEAGTRTAQDAATWIASKRSGGTDEQRRERKSRIRERKSANAAAQAARRAKGSNKSQQQKKRKGGDDDPR